MRYNGFLMLFHVEYKGNKTAFLLNIWRCPQGRWNMPSQKLQNQPQMAFTGAIKGTKGRKNQFAWIIYKKECMERCSDTKTQSSLVWEMGNEKLLPEGGRLVLCVTVSRSSNNDSKPFQVNSVSVYLLSLPFRHYRPFNQTLSLFDGRTSAKAKRLGS